MFYEWLSFLRDYPVQLFAAQMMFCVHMKRRKHFLVRFIPVVATFFVYSILFYIFEDVVAPLRALPLDLGFLLMFFWSILGVGLCFKCDWRQLLFVCSSAWAMQHFVHSFQRALASPIKSIFAEGGVTIPSVAADYIVCVLLVALSCAVYSAFYLVLIRRLLKCGGFDGFTNVRNIYLIVLSVISICIVYVLSYVTSQSGKDVYHLIYASCCCLLLLFIQFGLFEHSMVRENNERVKEMLKFEHEQQQLSKENMAFINRKCHDIKHQIEDLRSLVSNDALDARLREMQDAVLIYDSFVKTGNNTLDVLLTEKKLYCEKYNIRLTCIADGEKMEFMSEEDIWSLFGNILDNAIESVRNAVRAEDRTISLNVSAKRNLLVLHADNYCENADKIVFKDGLPQTTKPDSRYHGLGMQSIRYLTEKYGGTLSVTARGNTFTVNIVVPIPK